MRCAVPGAIFALGTCPFCQSIYPACRVLAIRYGIFDQVSLNWAAEQITGDKGTGWFDWMLWQIAHPEFPARASYAGTTVRMFARIDDDFMRFLTTEMTKAENMKIRLEEISWGGVAVDGIPSLENRCWLRLKKSSICKMMIWSLG